MKKLALFVIVMFGLSLISLPAIAQKELLPLGSQVLLPEFHGAIDLTYFDYGKDGYKSGKPTFDVHEFYLMTMVPISENVYAYMEPRYEHVNSAVELRQGYIQWNVKDALGFRFGRFYMPVGDYATTYYASTRKLVSNTYVNRLVGVTPWGDNGVMILGQLPLFNYKLAVVNGLKEDYITTLKPRQAIQTKDDNNSTKFLGGRLGFTPTKAVNIGVSGASGYYDNSDSLNLGFLDGDFTFNLDRLQIKGEYLTSTAQTTGEAVTSSGYYVHAALKLIEDVPAFKYLEAVVRYDTLNPGRQMQDPYSVTIYEKGQNLSRISLGLNVSPVEHFILKAEYQTTSSTPALELGGILFQACVDF